MKWDKSYNQGEIGEISVEFAGDKDQTAKIDRMRGFFGHFRVIFGWKRKLKRGTENFEEKIRVDLNAEEIIKFGFSVVSKRGKLMW